MLNQREFAKLLDVSPSTIFNWERGITKPNKVYSQFLSSLYVKEGAEIDITPATIKAIRLSNDLSQTEFAEKLGVGVSTVADWEQGNHPPRKNAQKRIYKFYLEHRGV